MLIAGMKCKKKDGGGNQQCGSKRFTESLYHHSLILSSSHTPDQPRVSVEEFQIHHVEPDGTPEDMMESWLVPAEDSQDPALCSRTCGLQARRQGV
jgi:hypothetical protein